MTWFTQNVLASLWSRLTISLYLRIFVHYTIAGSPPYKTTLVTLIRPKVQNYPSKFWSGNTAPGPPRPSALGMGVITFSIPLPLNYSSNQASPITIYSFYIFCNTLSNEPPIWQEFFFGTIWKQIGAQKWKIRTTGRLSPKAKHSNLHDFS